MLDWIRGTEWGASGGGIEPHNGRREEDERAEFIRRRELVRARLARLEMIADVRTARKQDDDG